MMTRKNNVTMTESNDNIDHKNVIINRISFECLQINKMFFFRISIKEDLQKTCILIQGFILDNACGPKKDQLFALYLFSAEVYPMPSETLFAPSNKDYFRFSVLSFLIFRKKLYRSPYRSFL